MRFRASRRKRFSVALSAALAGAVLAPTPAWAGGLVSPTITAPLDSAIITTSPLTVTADSPATFVRFELGVGPIDSDTPSVTAGVASGSLEVYGVNGLVTITAADCAAGPTCGAAGDSVQVDVNLPTP
ncbi:MAG: hypothetical protein ACJ74E_05515, partial [Actinomycetes bacterium]